MRLDPRHAGELAKTHQTLTADELSQFFNCTRWMAQCIPDYDSRIQLLRDLLEKAYEEGGKRKTTAIRKISESTIGWNEEYSAAFDGIQNRLKNAVWIAHFDQENPVSVFTDASDQHRAAGVTKCLGSEDNLKKPIDEQNHVPLDFFGAAIKGFSRDWSTLKKEGFSIYQALRSWNIS